MKVEHAILARLSASSASVGFNGETTIRDKELADLILDYQVKTTGREQIEKARAALVVHLKAEREWLRLRDAMPDPVWRAIVEDVFNEEKESRG